MCHPDPLSQLKDFFPRCCSDASMQALVISSLKSGLSCRVSSCKFMLSSRGSPHPKTGWRQRWNALPAVEPPGVRLPPRLQDSLASPCPELVSSFHSPGLDWSQGHFLRNFQCTNFHLSLHPRNSNCNRRKSERNKKDRIWEQYYQGSEESQKDL